MTTTNLIIAQDMVLRYAQDHILSLLPEGIRHSFRQMTIKYDTFSLRRSAMVTFVTGGIMGYSYHDRAFQLPAIHEDINIVEFVVRKITEFYFVVKG